MKKLPFSYQLAIGIATISITTLIIMVRFNYQMNTVSETAEKFEAQRIPTAQAANDLKSGIYHSNAALRGWMLLGDESFKIERADVWETEIDRPLEELIILSPGWSNLENVERLNRIRRNVYKIRTYQDEVEQISHTASAAPSNNIFLSEAAPNVKIMMNRITKMIDLEAKLPASKHRKKLLVQMADFCRTCALAVSKIRVFLISSDKKYIDEYYSKWAENETSYKYLEENTKMLTKEQKRLFQELSESRRKFVPLPKKIFDLRLEDHANLANYILGTKSAPAADLVLKDLKALVDDNGARLIQDFSAHRQEIVFLTKFSAGLFTFELFLIVGLGMYITRIVTRPINRAVQLALNIGEGEMDDTIDLGGSRELVQMGESLSKMRDQISSRVDELAEQKWLSDQIGKFSELAQGKTELQLLADDFMSELATSVEAGHGVFYYIDENSEQQTPLSLLGSYAFKQRKNVLGTVEIGEGLVGQCAKEKKTILLNNVPSDYIQINSGLGEKAPLNIIVAPILFEKRLLGVIELASFKEYSDIQLEMINRVTENVGVVINSVCGIQRTEELLQETQRQTEELQAQQEELRAANESLEKQTKELSVQTQNLKASEWKLQGSNEVLEEKSNDLRIQKEEIEIKSKDLEMASRYKSEFLANMSHELRTPLNSFLLLTKRLATNKYKNLNEDQIDDLNVIYEGGTDLLNLINDIMDLSKVESGKLQLQLKAVDLEDVCNNIEGLFSPATKMKSITLEVSKEENVPQTLITDSQRLRQILNNFLSNAFKFTEKGSVQMKIHFPKESTMFFGKSRHSGNTLAFSVIDTGVGISEDKQKEIFEAFQQEDGTTSRKYGGTGLGLTISRGLAKLLGGEIHLSSIKGEGSTFTLYLPMESLGEPGVGEELQKKTVESKSGSQLVAGGRNGTRFLSDDQDKIRKEDEVILIIEDDEKFAEILLGIVREQGYKGIIAEDGKNGLYLAFTQQPMGIFLDFMLPDMNGNDVLEQLKLHQKTRGVPVHVISGMDKETAAVHGTTIGFLEKPATEKEIKEVISKIEHFSAQGIRKILVVEDDKISQQAMIDLIKDKEIEIECVESGEAAIEKIFKGGIDCLILDIGLPDISGFEVLARLSAKKGFQVPPVVIYTGKKLTAKERSELNKYSATIISKDAESPGKLIDEAFLFLRSLTEGILMGRKTVPNGEQQLLIDRRILLVDDDMRNVFAITKCLQEAGLVVYEADNGQTALERLREQDGIELIVMDIMMPIMDGHEAIRRIRAGGKYKNVPIIALTAKAMPEDRAKCIAAGANDYLTKPVDIEKLLSMLKVWLFRK